MAVEEKIWCPRCEEERWGRLVAGGFKCGVCLNFIPGESVILADMEEEDCDA